MSQENVETLRAVYAGYERGDFTASLPLLDEDITLAIDSGIPDGGEYEGMEGVRDYMSRFLDPWESLTIAAESFREIGDTVLVAVHQAGIGRGSGVPVEHPVLPAVDLQRRQGRPARRDHERSDGPRGRGAVGVGEAGGVERSDRAPAAPSERAVERVRSISGSLCAFLKRPRRSFA